MTRSPDTTRDWGTMTITSQKRAFWARLAIFLACPAICAGQSSAAGAFAADGVEEIVVSAQKRDSTLTQTPVSVSVVGERWIEDSNLIALNDLADAVPNLTVFSDFLYNSTITMRGVGSYSRNIGFDERVSLYLDGIYLGPSYGLNQNLLDLEQVEVLRGPQGTYFGRNAIAGAINLKSRRPGDERVVKGRARYGSHDTLALQGYVALPLDTRWAVSLSAGLQKRDGLTDNLVTGETLGNHDRSALRAQVRYRTQAFEANLSLDRSAADERALIGDPLSDTFGVAPDAFAPAYGEVMFNTAPAQSLEAMGAGLDLEWTLANGGTLTSLTGLRATDAAMINDTDYSPADLLHVDYEEDYSHFTEELRYASASDRALRYVLGVSFLDQKARTDRDAIAGADGILVGMVPGSKVSNVGRVDTTAWGLFASADYDVSEQLTMSVGLRWSRDEKSASWMIDGSAAPAFGLATGTIEVDRADEDLSPTISLTYALSDAVSTFVRYAEGFKSGGYNLDFVNAGIFPAGLEFDKESARSYEAGLKGALSGGELWFSATAFWVDYDDFQVNQFRDLGGGRTAIVIANAAKVRTKGLELELRLAPTEGLDLRAWGAVLDAQYRDFASGGIGGSDVSGNRLEAPEFEAGFALDYSTALSDRLDAFVHLSFSHAGGYFITPDNIKAQQLLGGGTVPFGHIGARDMLSAKLGVASAGGWRVALYGENLLDDRSVSSSLRDFFGTISEVRREGRTYGVELGVEF